MRFIKPKVQWLVSAGALLVPPLLAALQSGIQPAWPINYAPFLSFALVIIAGAWHFGLAPGLIATFSSAVAIVWTAQGTSALGQEPLWSMGGLASFVLMGIVISIMGHYRLRQQTELQRSLARCEESKAVLDAICEHLPDGLCVIDRQTSTIQAISRYGLEFSGQSIDRLLGHSIHEHPWELLDPQSERPLTKEHQPLTRALELGEVTHNREYLLRRPEGALAPVLCSAGPILDHEGRVTGALVSWRDIGDRRASQERLERANRRLVLLSEAAGYLLQEDDPDRMVWEVFARIAEHLGLDAYLHYGMSGDGAEIKLESWGGFDAEGLDRLNPAEIAQSACVSGVARGGGQPIHLPHLESRGDAPPGLRRLGFYAAVCVPLAVGAQPLGALLFASRQRQVFDGEELDFLGTLCGYLAMAQERLRLHRQLADNVRELAAADRRKDEFLAMLAHELRNPLAPMRYAAQMLRLGKTDPDNLHKQREVIERQVMHLARLLDDLLDVSRITRGKIVLHSEPVELAELVRRVAETMRPQTEAHGQSFEIDVPESPVMVEGDPLRLEQIVRNLLGNALKFTESGRRLGVSLETERRPADAGRAWAALRVWDEGIGIAPEMQPHVFDLFTQADQTLDRSRGGLGIGLTMAQRLVQLHHGSISVHSAGLGRGAEFIVRLPMIEIPDEEPSALVTPITLGNSATAVATETRRILVVEDNQDLANSLTELLQAWGHEVQTAFDGPHGFGAALAWRPDIVLLDIGLPGLDGYQVARMIRQERQLQDVLVVALTGYGRDEDRLRAREAGFNYHLTKPVDPDQLRVLIDSQASELA